MVPRLSNYPRGYSLRITKDKSKGRRVILTPEAEEWHRCVGRIRSSESIGLPTKGGWKATTEEKRKIDEEAAGAELAVAACLGVKWVAWVNSFNFPDVGDDIEVKWTRTIGNPRLCVRPNPDPHLNWRYFLVNGYSPNYHVLGWAYGHEILKEENKDAPYNRPWAWFLDADKLREV